MRMALMCSTANWRVCEVVLGAPVTTRLPRAVHLTAASMAWGGEILLSLSLRVLQMTSGLGLLSSASPRCARSTMRLGLGGLTLAIAKYVFGGFLIFPLFPLSGGRPFALESLSNCFGYFVSMCLVHGGWSGSDFLSPVGWLPC